MDKTVRPESLTAGPLEKEIRVEQIRLLYRNAFTGITIHIINAFVVAVVLWNQTPRRFVVVWFLVHTLVALARMIIVRMYPDAPAADRRNRHWAVSYSVGAACAGASWGAIGFGGAIYLSLPYQIFVAFAVGGTAIGALATSGAFLPAYVAFLLPALLPLGLGFLLLGDSTYAAMGALTLVFSGALYIMGRNVNHSILRSLKLSLERAESIDAVCAANDEAIDNNRSDEVRERVGTEAELRERESLYRAMFETNQAVTLLIDPVSGAIVDINPAACKFYGYPLREMRRKNIIDLNGGSREQVSEWMARAKTGRQGRFGACHRLASGETRDVEIYAGPIKLEGHKLLLCIFHDITERKQAQQALKEAHDGLETRLRERTAELQRVNEEQARFVAIVEATIDFVAIVNLEGQICYLNRAGRTLIGVDADADVTDINIRDFHPKWAIAHILNEGIPTAIRNGVWTGEVALLNNRGQEVPVSKVIISHKAPDGSVQFLVTITRDVTERKRAEEALREAKEEAERVNAAKSRFLAAANHDLRQPLQTLSLLTGLLSKKLKEPEVRKLIGDQRQALGAMSDLLDTLLDISKLETGAVKPEITEFRIGSLFARIECNFQEQAHAKGLEFRVAPCDAVVRSDAAQLERVIQNLISNAIRYTVAGKVLLGCRRRGECLRIEVWDTGMGIPEGQLKRIFEDFYQLGNPARDRSKGLGLGLAVVDRITHLLGHRIEVRSVVDKGSVFAVEVPMADLNGASVLLVEDDPAVLDAARLFLESCGFRLTTAMTGNAAFKKLAQDKVRPDIIITDYRLPGGETGEQVIQGIRDAAGLDIPAIIITGETTPLQLSIAGSIDCEVLHKPVDVDELTTLMDELLTSRTPNGSIKALDC